MSYDLPRVTTLVLSLLNRPRLRMQLVDSVVDNFGHFYPELAAKREIISEIIRSAAPCCP